MPRRRRPKNRDSGRQRPPKPLPHPSQCDKPSLSRCGPPDKRIASLPRQALQPQWLFERHVADKEKPATHDGAVQIASQAATNAWQAVSTAHRNALEAARNDVSPIRARSQVQEAKSASAPPSCVANWILS